VQPSSATSVLDPEGAHLAALRRVTDFTGTRVLEVGCGDGRLTIGVAEQAASVFALDPDTDAVSRARDSFPPELAGRVTFRAASASAVEIPPTEFDIVLFSWSL
jgi:ubiquinone/menaquinone biosynthesis C-methylase UbiE